MICLVLHQSKNTTLAEVISPILQAVMGDLIPVSPCYNMAAQWLRLDAVPQFFNSSQNRPHAAKIS
jgi:hypothetical protein